MALDPRIRAELDRRGPANVRELLRTRTGPGDRDPVALQLAGADDASRSDVEDWLREKEREAEAVGRDTLKWAKRAGYAAIVGVIVAAVSTIITARSCSYTSATYNNQNRPLIEFGETRVGGFGNDLFFVTDLLNNGEEDAMNIRLQFVGIEFTMKRSMKLQSETPSVWPRLAHRDKDEVKIKIHPEFPYMLICIYYGSERVHDFTAKEAFFALSSLQAGYRSPSGPSPSRSQEDALAQISSCAKP